MRNRAPSYDAAEKDGAGARSGAGGPAPVWAHRNRAASGDTAPLHSGGRSRRHLYERVRKRQPA